MINRHITQFEKYNITLYFAVAVGSILGKSRFTMAEGE